MSTKINLNDSILLYGNRQQARRHTPEGIEESELTLEQWNWKNFLTGVNIFSGATETLNYEFSRERQTVTINPENYDKDNLPPGGNPERAFSSQRDDVLLAFLSNKTMFSVARYQRRGYGSQYTIYPADNWPATAEEAETTPMHPCLLPLEIKNIKTISAESEPNEDSKEIKIYSQYGKSTVDYFNSAIDLTNISLPISLDLPSIIRSRQSDYARTNKFRDYTSSSIHIDSISSFSCIGDTLDKEIFLRAAGTTPVKVIRLNSLYRGGGGKVTMELTRATPQKIVKGGYVFPFLIKTLCLNQDTQVVEYKIIFCLGLFDDLAKIIKYKRSRAYIPQLLKDIEKWDGLKLFDPKAYQKKMEEKYGEHALYWEGLSDIFHDDLPEDATAIDQTLETSVSPKDLIYLQKAQTIASSKIAKDFEDIRTAHSTVTMSMTEKKREIEKEEYNEKHYTQQITRFTAELKSAQENQRIAEVAIKKAQNDLEGYTSANKAISTEFEAAKGKYYEFLGSISDDLTNENAKEVIRFCQNLKNTGIQICHIDYAVREEGENYFDDIINIQDQPKLAFDAKQRVTSPNANGDLEVRVRLNSIQFSTTSPVIIYVDKGKDGTTAKKIVGGPYNVSVTRNGISISLASTKACFGFRTSSNGDDYISAWVHPHTQSFTLSSSNWENFSKTLLSRTGNACLGEAAPALNKAFESGDPKQAIFAAMTWISNANSSDTWGKHWKNFPKLEDVYISGRPRPIASDTDTEEEINITKLVTTEDGMDALSELASDLLAKLAEKPEVIPQEPTPVIVPEEPEGLAERITRLDTVDYFNIEAAPGATDAPEVRRPGYPGYTPLGVHRAGTGTPVADMLDERAAEPLGIPRTGPIGERRTEFANVTVVTEATPEEQDPDPAIEETRTDDEVALGMPAAEEQEPSPEYLEETISAPLTNVLDNFLNNLGETTGPFTSALDQAMTSTSTAYVPPSYQEEPRSNFTRLSENESLTETEPNTTTNSDTN